MDLTSILIMLVVRVLDRLGGRIVERVFHRHSVWEQPCQIALIALLCVALALMIREKRPGSAAIIVTLGALAYGAGAFSRLI